VKVKKERHPSGNLRKGGRRKKKKPSLPFYKTYLPLMAEQLQRRKLQAAAKSRQGRRRERLRKAGGQAGETKRKRRRRNIGVAADSF